MLKAHEYPDEIATVDRLLKTATGKRKHDLEAYKRRLNRELRQHKYMKEKEKAK